MPAPPNPKLTHDPRPPWLTAMTDDIAPTCGPTLARLQQVLDGDRPAHELDADPHAAACATCRDRIRAARVLLIALAHPAESATDPVLRTAGRGWSARSASGSDSARGASGPPLCPPVLTDKILDAIRADRRRRARQRVFATAGALAAALLVAAGVWWWNRPAAPVPENRAVEIVQTNPEPELAPAPRPVRLDAQLTQAGEALREGVKPITEPAANAPKVFASLVNALGKPGVAPVADYDAVRKSLADIPDAAMAGLEPVTGSAQKAFTRLVRDVVAIKPKP